MVQNFPTLLLSATCTECEDQNKAGEEKKRKPLFLLNVLHQIFDFI